MATVYSTATSLDGFIADERDDLGWLFATPPHDDAADGERVDGHELGFEAFLANVGAVVCGASTHDWIRRELTKDGQAFEWPYQQPSWVVTHRRLEPVDGVELFAGDVAELHPRMLEAAEGRDVWIVGGGDLAGQFADRGLLDRVLVHVCPVVLGAGKPLLPRRLRLHRQRVERDGQLTAMLFDVVGTEPRAAG